MGTYRSPFSSRSSEKGVAAASCFHSAQSSPGSFTNTAEDATGPHIPCVWLKKYCVRALPALEQNGFHGGDASHTSHRVGEKVGIDAQWQAMDGTCGKPRRARKRSAAEGLGRDPTAEGEVAEISISMWMVRGPLWGLR